MTRGSASPPNFAQTVVKLHTSPGLVRFDAKTGLDKNPGGCGWRGYEREEKEGEREVDNLSTCGCVIQLYLWENTRFIEIREFGWGFLMLTS